ncbi:hypothetical protein NC653_013576 [Populus alba x Populus x berolinensis]|uniref:Uncharacterized protein n=1 Tax=Populus alba x Populus x berolinensis TaxID=444605 RepID=A0AAD6QVL2_9ROSI|nr:hypothetical protein NC653_013576 [Populus alba x Populus x berolinensis]
MEVECQNSASLTSGKEKMAFIVLGLLEEDCLVSQLTHKTSQKTLTWH